MISLLNRVKFINSCPVSLTYSATSKLNMSVTATEEKTDLKRASSENVEDCSEVSAKKALVVKEEKVKRRKIAMLISYLGQGYLGLQRNPGTKTIEEDVLKALLKVGYISEDVYNQPQLTQFQRAARTDKGVSALRQVLSLKLPESSSTEAINENLPDQIRAIAILRVTKGFNCKGNCDGRTYSYMTPTFAFAPIEEVSESYRLPPEVHDKVGKVLKLYEGTHNFHNFTSKRLPTEPSAKRYVMSFVSGDPFVIDGLEFVVLKVKGQSFMLHQIRKMVGLLIAIAKGLTSSDTLIRAWDKDKLDIPIAPGLGLLLEEVHYDRYNNRYGSDGIHEAIDWSKWKTEIEEFRDKFILPTVVETEKNEKSMLAWLETLNMHTFDIRTEHIHTELDQALEKKQGLLSAPSKIDALIAAAEAIDTER